ncbi:cytochrome P450 [Peniophora sp. CONT]|nr:cytochrome P450 [Peniophora sp. CONT]
MISPTAVSLAFAFALSIRLTSSLALSIWIVLALALFSRIALAVYSRRAKRLAMRNVRGPASDTFIEGNLTQLNDVNGLDFLNNLLAEYGPVSKLHGLCGDTVLVASDPRTLSHLLLKDPDNFPEIDFTGTTIILEYMFGPGLISANGSRHRHQRKMLNPLFSTAHMRRISPLVNSITKQYRDRFATQVPHGKACIDVAPGLACLGLEIIGQAGFGHTFNALDGGAEEYIRAAKEILPSTTALAPYILLLVATGLSSLPAGLLRVVGSALTYLSPPLKSLMAGVDYLFLTAQGIWRAKKAAYATGDALLQESVVQGGDLLSVLLKENALANRADKLSDEELLAQLNTFIIAGAESTSTVICRVLYQLALHPETQDRLRAEVSQAGEDLEYDTLMNLPLLDAVCRETMRQHTFFPFRSRLVTKATTIPRTDGETIYVPAGTEIIMNLHGLNTDPAIWGADAQKWRPERWLNPLPESVGAAKVPSIYGHSMTFLGGPKSCIGYTLAVLEIKNALAVLLPQFRFDLPEQQEIVWRFGITISPSVKGDKTFNPTMPLLVSRLD